MIGLRSPGTATPEVKEDWQPPEIVADISLDPDGAELMGSGAGRASPFAGAAQQPLEETVIVTPGRVFHGLTRPPLQPRYCKHPLDFTQSGASLERLSAWH